MMPGGGVQRPPAPVPGVGTQQSRYSSPQQIMSFRTKTEVDRHVDTILRQETTEQGRSMKFFSIARAYQSVREFGLAKRYLHSYIEAHPTQPGLADSYKVMGDILSGTDDFEGAYDAYKKSFEVTPSRVTLNRICDLLSNGFGSEKETPESMKEWFTKQKTASNAAINEPRQRPALGRPDTLPPTYPPAYYPAQGTSPAFLYQTPSPVMSYVHNGAGGDPNFQRTPQHLQGRSARNSPLITPKNLLNQLQPSTPQQINGVPETSDTDLKHLEKRIDDLEKNLEGRLSQMETRLESVFQAPKAEELRKSEQFYKEVDLKLEATEKLITAKLAKLETGFGSTEKFIATKLDKLEIGINRIESAEKIFVARLNQLEVASTSDHSDRMALISEEVKSQADRVLEAVNRICITPVRQVSVDVTDTKSDTKPPAFDEKLNPKGVLAPAHFQILNQPICSPIKNKINETQQSQAAAAVSSFTFTMKPNVITEKSESVAPAPAFSVTMKPNASTALQAEKAQPAAALSSFTFPMKPNTISLFETEKSQAAAPVPTFAFALNTNTIPSFGFVDVSKQGTPGGFAFGNPSPTTSTLFFNPVLPIFGTSKSVTATPEAVKEKEDGDEDHAEEFIPTAEFAPVIPLPPLIELSKGDEHENTIFEVRAKLLRLYEDEREGKKEWKERGLGNIKILQDKQRSSKVRIVMWREQIHKLACNHHITKDMRFNFFNNSDKSLIWGATDFTEGEARKEIFVCKFGKTEQCKEFKDHVDRLLDLITNSVDEPSPVATSKIPELKANDRPDQRPLSELFKKADGTWTCSGCYLQNKPGIDKCLSCEASKPGASPGTPDQQGLAKAETTQAASTIQSFSFGLNSSSTPSFGFGDLAKQRSDTGFAFGKPSPSTSSLFSSPVVPIFGTSTGSTTIPDTIQEKETGDEDHAEEFVPTAEFAPVIPLPPLVELSKGDEHENTVFEVRAKLLRLHEDEQGGKKEWKERGLGNIKILQDKERPSKVRIVMWREQIHKLACNHHITKDTLFNFFNNSDKSLMWGATDFTDGEPRKEIFVCKFGKSEQCKEFKDHVDRLLIVIANSTDESSPVSADNVSEPKVTVGLDKEPLSELFKKGEGTWTCNGCYLENKPEADKCLSCAALKPGANSRSPDHKAPAYSTDTVSTQPAPTIPSFSFGLNSSATSAFGFGDLAKQRNEGFAFGKPSSTTSTLFSSPVIPIFGTPLASTIPDGVHDKEAGDEDHAEEFVPTAEFTPVIPLPPLVQLSKGDENENTVYEVRAKLLRLCEDEQGGKKEWKERGLGNIKILQDKLRSSKVRIVMWREQIHKLACNHHITKDMRFNFFNNSDKSLIWGATDFTEGEARKEIFVCKFGKPEQCKEFMDNVNRLLDLITNSTDEPSSVPASKIPEPTANDGPDQRPLSELFKKPVGSWTCSICYLENKPEDRKCPSCETLKPGEVEELKSGTAPALPQFTFGFGFKPVTPPSTAKDAQDHECTCAGCIGCDPDNFDFTKHKSRSVPTYPEQTLTPEEYKTHMGKEKLANFSFTDLFKSTGANSAVVDSSPLFSGFGAPSNLGNPFVLPPSSTSTVPSFQSQPPMFGFGTATQPTFSFGVPNFGSPAATAPSTTVAVPPPASVQQQDLADRAENHDGDDEYEDDEPTFEAVASLKSRKHGESALTDLGLGLVCVAYDSNIYCNRFTYMGEASEVPEVDHLICADTQLNSEGEFGFSWSALMENEHGTLDRLELQLTFVDEEIASDFLDRWCDSNEMASQVNVTEAYLAEDEQGE